VDEVFGLLPESNKLKEDTDAWLNYLKTLMHREIRLNYHHWQLVQARNLANERLVGKMTSFDEETAHDFARSSSSRSTDLTECQPVQVEFLESV
jgi:hypothetical protein